MKHPRIDKLMGQLLAAGVAVLALCAPAHASLVGYQNQAAFLAAIAGWSSNTSNFDALAAGTLYADGSGPVGSGFSLSLTGPDAPSLLPAVADQFWTTSASHYLGLNNPDTALEAGDSLSFSFATAQQAFGLFIIGTSDIGAADISLTSGSDSVFNGGLAELTDGSGSYAYFLGFVSSDATGFSSVTLHDLTLSDPRLLNIAVDDVVLAINDGDGHVAVPEPATLALTLIGLGLLGAASRRHLARNR